MWSINSHWIKKFSRQKRKFVKVFSIMENAISFKSFPSWSKLCQSLCFLNPLYRFESKHLGMRCRVEQKYPGIYGDIFSFNNLIFCQTFIWLAYAMLICVSSYTNLYRINLLTCINTQTNINTISYSKVWFKELVIFWLANGITPYFYSYLVSFWKIEQKKGKVQKLQSAKHR